MQKIKFGFLFIAVVIIALFFLQNIPLNYSLAQQIDAYEQIYYIYDENDNYLSQAQNVEVGDKFITKEFFEYEIIFVDEVNGYATAKFISDIEKPKITKKQIHMLLSGEYEKLIAIYCTHNDESYETGDGYSSIYGEGGIHDIASMLAKCFSEIGISCVFDKTLHIPHDSYAYSRSKATATSLLNEYNPDALFDIHRDGASRKQYVYTDLSGEEHCKVRIVVGQANPNREKNIEFAKYLMSIGEVVCPWLFLDIYYAKGHYNQNLTNKALLFEMGSHLVEKSLVEETVPYLADVIATALYSTTVDSEGNLTIGSSSENVSNLNNYFEQTDIDENWFSVEDIDEKQNTLSKTELIVYIAIVLLSIIFILGFNYSVERKFS